MNGTQEENERKGEAMLTKFGAIKKIYVIPYIFSNDDYIDPEDWERCGVLISDNQEFLEKYAKEREYKERQCCLDHEDLIEMREYEARERYGDDLIEYILREDGYVADNDDDYIYDETYMSIEELRERRGIESDPFDAEEIISKIAREYVITPRRKDSLIEIINKLL
jgi:hypothetical protein